MNIKKSFITVVSFVVFSLFFVNSALADFGNFDTYDNGSWDSGSWDTSSDWGSGYDPVLGTGGNYYYFTDYEDSDSGNNILSFIIVIAIILIIVFVYSKKGVASGGRVNTERNYRRTYTPVVYPNKNAEIGVLIQTADPSFSSEKFISFANEAYVKLQTAWSERDLEPIRLLLAEELFAQASSQIQEYRRLGRINKMERIAVQESYITDYSSGKEKETLTVYLYATQKDYIVDENTNSVLDGSAEQYRHSKYIITFIRAKGTLTQDNNGIQITNCPNCGAPLEITASGKCSYCDSVITNEDHAWVISAMKRVN